MAAWYAGLLVFAHVRVSAAAESAEATQRQERNIEEGGEVDICLCFLL